MTDYENWVRFHETYIGPVDTAIASRVYDEYYSCKCATCRRRKAEGFIPIKLKYDDACVAPLDAYGLEIAYAEAIKVQHMSCHICNQASIHEICVSCWIRKCHAGLCTCPTPQIDKNEEIL